MKGSLQQIGFENQKLFLMMLLTLKWKDVSWSYEGNNENAGDLSIGNNIYEVKTWVDGKNDKLILGSAPPKDFRKAVHQLFRIGGNKEKFIITNKRVLDRKGRLYAEDIYNFTELFRNDKVIYREENNSEKEHVYSVDKLKKIKVMVYGVEKGKNTKELENIIFNKIEKTLISEIDDTDGELNIKSIYKLVSGLFTSSISKTISKTNVHNTIRYYYFYVITEILNLEIDHIYDEIKLIKFHQGMQTIKNSIFFGENDWESKLIKSGDFSEDEVNIFKARVEKIYTWIGKLLNCKKDKKGGGK